MFRFIRRLFGRGVSKGVSRGRCDEREFFRDVGMCLDRELLSDEERALEAKACEVFGGMSEEAWVAFSDFYYDVFELDGSAFQRMRGGYDAMDAMRRDAYRDVYRVLRNFYILTNKQTKSL